jgi:hypothetical protein
MPGELKTTPSSAVSGRFYQAVDWAAFGLASALSLAIYLFTLAPEVTLSYSGIFSAAAIHPGSSMPPGHPLWAVYGWLFVKVIPFFNIAWRLGVASAVAGALTCGLIALMVSRVGLLSIESVPNFQKFSPVEKQAVRLVCGCVAGLGFGLDGCFWCKTVIADSWPLSLFLFALAVCLLTRWFFAPERKRDLYLAALVFGLALSESQALIPAAFGLPFLLTAGNRKIGREIFFGIGIFLCGLLLLKHRPEQLGWTINQADQRILVCVASISTLIWAVISAQTRRFFSEWKTTGTCATLFFAGLGAYFVLPVLSMTNPPMNWGYSRTVEGFFHLVSRGQFESLNPTSSFQQLLVQGGIYANAAKNDFGAIYLLAAITPFLLLRSISSSARPWLIGSLAAWFFFTLLMVIGLSPDRLAVEYVKPYFAATHLFLAVFSGCGLMLVAAFCGKPATEKSSG